LCVHVDVVRIADRSGPRKPVPDAVGVMTIAPGVITTASR
jgi:hypothetical protein